MTSDEVNGRSTLETRALTLSPRFILLDEPFAGIDPITVLDLQEVIRGLATSGIGILITDHNVRDTLSIVDRAYIITRERSSGPVPPPTSPTIRRSAGSTWGRGSGWNEHAFPSRRTMWTVAAALPNTGAGS